MQRARVAFDGVALGLEQRGVARHEGGGIGFRRFQIVAKRLEFSPARRAQIDIPRDRRLLDFAGQFFAGHFGVIGHPGRHGQQLLKRIGGMLPGRGGDSPGIAGALQCRMSFTRGRAGQKPAEIADVIGPDRKPDKGHEQAQEGDPRAQFRIRSRRHRHQPPVAGRLLWACRQRL